MEPYARTSNDSLHEVSSSQSLTSHPGYYAPTTSAVAYPEMSSHFAPPRSTPLSYISHNQTRYSSRYYDEPTTSSSIASLYYLNSQNANQYNSYSPSNVRIPFQKSSSKGISPKSLEVTRVGPARIFSSIASSEGPEIIVSCPNMAHSMITNIHHRSGESSSVSSSKYISPKGSVLKSGNSNTSSGMHQLYQNSYNSKTTNFNIPTLIKAEEPTTIAASYSNRDDLFDVATDPIPYALAKSDEHNLYKSLEKSYAPIKRVENPWVVNKEFHSASSSNEIKMQRHTNEAYNNDLSLKHPRKIGPVNGLRDSKQIECDNSKYDGALDLSVKTVRQTADSTASESEMFPLSYPENLKLPNSTKPNTSSWFAKDGKYSRSYMVNSSMSHPHTPVQRDSSEANMSAEYHHSPIERNISPLKRSHESSIEESSRKYQKMANYRGSTPSHNYLSKNLNTGSLNVGYAEYPQSSYFGHQTDSEKRKNVYPKTCKVQNFSNYSDYCVNKEEYLPKSSDYFLPIDKRNPYYVKNNPQQSSSHNRAKKTECFSPYLVGENKYSNYNSNSSYSGYSKPYPKTSNNFKEDYEQSSYLFSGKETKEDKHYFKPSVSVSLVTSNNSPSSKYKKNPYMNSLSESNYSNITPEYVGQSINHPIKELDSYSSQFSLTKRERLKVYQGSEGKMASNIKGKHNYECYESNSYCDSGKLHNAVWDTGTTQALNPFDDSHDQYLQPKLKYGRNYPNNDRAGTLSSSYSKDTNVKPVLPLETGLAAIKNPVFNNQPKEYDKNSFGVPIGQSASLPTPHVKEKLRILHTNAEQSLGEKLDLCVTSDTYSHKNMVINTARTLGIDSSCNFGLSVKKELLFSEKKNIVPVVEDLKDKLLSSLLSTSKHTPKENASSSESNCAASLKKQEFGCLQAVKDMYEKKMTTNDEPLVNSVKNSISPPVQENENLIKLNDKIISLDIRNDSTERNSFDSPEKNNKSDLLKSEKLNCLENISDSISHNMEFSGKNQYKNNIALINQKLSLQSNNFAETKKLTVDKKKAEILSLELEGNIKEENAAFDSKTAVSTNMAVEGEVATDLSLSDKNLHHLESPNPLTCKPDGRKLTLRTDLMAPTTSSSISTPIQKSLPSAELEGNSIFSCVSSTSVETDPSLISPFCSSKPYVSLHSQYPFRPESSYSVPPNLIPSEIPPLSHSAPPPVTICTQNKSSPYHSVSNQRSTQPRNLCEPFSSIKKQPALPHSSQTPHPSNSQPQSSTPTNSNRNFSVSPLVIKQQNSYQKIPSPENPPPIDALSLSKSHSVYSPTQMLSPSHQFDTLESKKNLSNYSPYYLNGSYGATLEKYSNHYLSSNSLQIDQSSTLSSSSYPKDSSFSHSNFPSSEFKCVSKVKSLRKNQSASPSEYSLEQDDPVSSQIHQYSEQSTNQIVHPKSQIMNFQGPSNSKFASSNYQSDNLRNEQYSQLRHSPKLYSNSTKQYFNNHSPHALSSQSFQYSNTCPSSSQSFRTSTPFQNNFHSKNYLGYNITNDKTSDTHYQQYLKAQSYYYSGTAPSRVVYSSNNTSNSNDQSHQSISNTSQSIKYSQSSLKKNSFLHESSPSYSLSMSNPPLNLSSHPKKTDHTTYLHKQPLENQTNYSSNSAHHPPYPHTSLHSPSSQLTSIVTQSYTPISQNNLDRFSSNPQSYPKITTSYRQSNQIYSNKLDSHLQSFPVTAHLSVIPSISNEICYTTHSALEQQSSSFTTKSTTHCYPLAQSSKANKPYNHLIYEYSDGSDIHSRQNSAIPGIQPIEDKLSVSKISSIAVTNSVLVNHPHQLNTRSLDQETYNPPSFPLSNTTPHITTNKSDFTESANPHSFDQEPLISKLAFESDVKNNLSSSGNVIINEEVKENVEKSHSKHEKNRSTFSIPTVLNENITEIIKVPQTFIKVKDSDIKVKEKVDKDEFDLLLNDLEINFENVTSKKSCILGKRYAQKLQHQEAIDKNEIIVPEPIVEDSDDSDPVTPVKFRGKFKSIKDKAVERVILTYASHSDESATEMIPDDDASDYEQELIKEIKAKARKVRKPKFIKCETTQGSNNKSCEKLKSFTINSKEDGKFDFKYSESSESESLSEFSCNSTSVSSSGSANDYDSNSDSISSLENLRMKRKKFSRPGVKKESSESSDSDKVIGPRTRMQKNASKRKFPKKSCNKFLKKIESSDSEENINPSKEKEDSDRKSSLGKINHDLGDTDSGEFSIIRRTINKGPKKISKKKRHVISSASENDMQHKRIKNENNFMEEDAVKPRVKRTILQSDSDESDKECGLKRNFFEKSIKPEAIHFDCLIDKNDPVIMKINAQREEELNREDVIEMNSWRIEVSDDMLKLLHKLPENLWRQFWQKPNFKEDFPKGWQQELKAYKLDAIRTPKKLFSVPPESVAEKCGKKFKDGKKGISKYDTLSPAKNTRSKCGIVKTNLVITDKVSSKVVSRPEISSVMQDFFEKVMGGPLDILQTGMPFETKKLPIPFSMYNTPRVPTGLTPTPSVAPSMLASDDSDRDSLASLRTDLPASDSVPIARRHSIANSLIKKLKKKYNGSKVYTQWLNKPRSILETTNKPQLLPTPGIPNCKISSHGSANMEGLSLFRKDSIQKFKETFEAVRSKNIAKHSLNNETIQAIFGVEVNVKEESMEKNKIKNESPVQLEEIVMPTPPSPVASILSHSSTSMDFLIQDDDDSEIRSEYSGSITGGEFTSLQVNPKFKRKMRKFRSGFDYIPKRRKKVIKPEEEQIGVSRKKIPIRRNVLWPEEAKDIAVEVRNWVTNKGLGETVLHKAARLKYHDVVLHCLESSDFNVNVRDNAGYTPLHEACNRGNLDIAQLLCAHGAFLNAPGYGGKRPLHEAIENGFPELARLLIAYGADPSLSTYAGQSCLSLATDSNCITFLSNYLCDLRGEKGTACTIQGPAKVFETEEQGNDFFAECPDDIIEENIVNQFDEFAFEFSDRPLLITYRIKNSKEQYVLEKELLHTLNMTLYELVAAAGKIETLHLDKEDFERMAKCCILGYTALQNNKIIKDIVLVKYTANIRKLLDINTVIIK